MTLHDELYRRAKQVVTALGIDLVKDRADIQVQILRSYLCTRIELSFETYSRHGSGSTTSVTKFLRSDITDSEQMASDIISEFRIKAQANKQHFYK